MSRFHQLFAGKTWREEKSSSNSTFADAGGGAGEVVGVPLEQAATAYAAAIVRVVRR
jgi:hypothetical protein